MRGCELPVMNGTLIAPKNPLVIQVCARPRGPMPLLQPRDPAVPFPNSRRRPVVLDYWSVGSSSSNNDVRRAHGFGWTGNLRLHVRILEMLTQ
jgi:hypothetical protein